MYLYPLERGAAGRLLCAPDVYLISGKEVQHV